MNYLLSLLSPGQWIIVGVAVVALAAINFPTLWGMFKGMKLPSIGGKTAVATGIPTRREVLDYLAASYSFFEDKKCKEGMEAISEAVTHAFHEHDEQGNVKKSGAK